MLGSHAERRERTCHSDFYGFLEQEAGGITRLLRPFATSSRRHLLAYECDNSPTHGTLVRVFGLSSKPIGPWLRGPPRGVEFVERQRGHHAGINFPLQLCLALPKCRSMHGRFWYSAFHAAEHQGNRTAMTGILPRLMTCLATPRLSIESRG